MCQLLARLLCPVLLLLASAASATGSDAPPLSYAGKTVVVTGSTDGLGRELARSFVADGAHVVVHGRNVERGEALVAELGAAGPGTAEFIVADFASLAAVNAFADTVLARHPKLDVLVNNAGIAIPGGQPRRASADGYELQFAVNYLAGWVLLHRLRSALAAAAPSRILNVASGSADAIDFDDVMLEKPGAHARGYGQSKLAQVMMTTELAPEFLRDGITMISLHPATMMPTTMVVKDLGLAPRSTLEEGRDHVMGLARSPTIVPGTFYAFGRPMEPRDPQGLDATARARLVALSAELTGTPAN